MRVADLALSPGGAVGWARPLLRRAADAGITMFDLDFDRAWAATVDTVLAALAGRREPLNLLVRMPPEDAGDPRPIQDLSRRVGPSCRLFLVASGAEGARRLSETLERVRSEGTIIAWGVALEEAADESALGRIESAGPQFVTAPLRATEPRQVRAVAQWAERTSLPVVATDPFGGGLLDGARLDPYRNGRDPRAAPQSVATLKREFAPVLRLGFLTATRRRTLPQAALLYVLRFPFVVTVSVPLPAPERLDDLLRATETGPLSEDELAALDRLERPDVSGA